MALSVKKRLHFPSCQSIVWSKTVSQLKFFFQMFYHLSDLAAVKWNDLKMYTEMYLAGRLTQTTFVIVTLLAPNSIRSMNKIWTWSLVVIFFNTDSSLSTHEDWNKVLSLLLENVWPPTMKKQEVLAFIRWCYAFTHVWSSRDMSSSWDSVIKMRARG